MSNDERDDFVWAFAQLVGLTMHPMRATLDEWLDVLHRRYGQQLSLVIQIGALPDLDAALDEIRAMPAPAAWQRALVYLDDAARRAGVAISNTSAAVAAEQDREHLADDENARQLAELDADVSAILAVVDEQERP
ncbi:hypothetical protein [Nocardia camponoti]|uniref:Uncharacterized protein n=1 Tax=Nocardia camponoti TaxID=1616106 RepID=A0A917QFU1_9NOCA|nr:hypothetical protein [Nocardia camponoti]GGK48371.1 hypothetical protein GCM10011591_19710 [Nocardia camponoti]